MFEVIILIILFLSTIGQAKPVKLSDIATTPQFNFNIGSIISVSNSKEKKVTDADGYMEPTGGAAKDAIDLGLSPKWTAVLDNVDKDRMGYSSFCISKKCKDNPWDNDVAQLKTKFSNKG